MNEESKALLHLSLTKGIGTTTYRMLLERFGSASAVLNARRTELEGIPGIGTKLADELTRSRNNVNIDKELALAQEHGVNIVPYTHEDYPHNLRAIYDPPLVLYIKGKLNPSDVLSMAIVGSRRCTYYGQSQSKRLARLLGQSGFTIVSGLARGIDTVAHQGALEVGARTITVMGCGLGRVYPRENRELAERISCQGAVVSELPMLTPPSDKNFPPRNRLISGLSLGVVVVEASQRSGALITAHWALEQGKEVFAVPGQVDSPYSRGTHRLLKEGAKLVEDVNDIIEELGPLAETLSICDEKEEVQDPRSLALNSQEKKIFSLLSSQPKTIDEITEESQLPASNVASTLMILEIRKLIKQLSGKRFVKA
ncbi:MAG: DNA-processing protein DprA [Candidatus Brocadiales bacterium]